MFHCRLVLFSFSLLFLVDSSNQHYLGIFVVVSLDIFIIIIFVRMWFINYPKDQIIILRGVFYEVDEILGEFPGDEGVRILVLLPHGRLADGNPSPITYLFQLNIARVDGIWVTSSAVASGYIEYFSISVCTASFSYFWTSSHFFGGIQLVSLLQRLHLLWGLYNNPPSPVQFL